MRRYAARLRALAPYREEAGYVALGLIVGGALLGGIAWTRSPEVSGTTAAGGGGVVTFDYPAQVPRSAAYQSTEVKPPQPVFR